MVDLRKLGEGVSLAGEYTLEQFMGGDHAAAFFATSLPGGERALVKLIAESSCRAGEQLAIWQRTRHLRHPRLLDLLDSGRAEVSGAPCLYAVFEYPDDNLASAIEHGPLSEEETRDVVYAALEALRYLHGQGLVHGAIDPQHIVAVGNNIKLATDALRESDDLEGHSEDVRQLGELVKSLVAPNPVGEPLRTVVEHATEADSRNRWTLAEIAAAMRAAPVNPVAPLTPPAMAAPPEPVPAPPESVPPPQSMERAPEVHTASFEKGAVRAAELPPLVRRQAAESSPPAHFPRWIFVSMAAVLLLILGLNLRKKPEAPAAPPSVERVMPPNRPSARPELRNEAARAVESKPSPVEVSRGGKAMWRVVAFTYASQELAAKKAKYVNEKWPAMHAGVYAPKDRPSYYLVVLGGRMTHDEAQRLQKKARGAGLPRDTYIQNYSE